MSSSGVVGGSQMIRFCLILLFSVLLPTQALAGDYIIGEPKLAD